MLATQRLFQELGEEACFAALWAMPEYRSGTALSRIERTLRPQYGVGTGCTVHSLVRQPLGRALASGAVHPSVRHLAPPPLAPQVRGL